MTLDGYFEGPGSDLSFMQYAWCPELESFINDQAKDFGAIVFGRRTYEGMASYWSDKTDYIGKVMNETPKVVFSKSLLNASWQNSRVAGENMRAEIEKIKRESAKDAYVLGSANLCAKLASENLLDEYRIGLVSIFLGKGTPLFAMQRAQMPLKLLESKPLGDKAVLLRYVPALSK